MIDGIWVPSVAHVRLGQKQTCAAHKLMSAKCQ